MSRRAPWRFVLAVVTLSAALVACSGQSATPAVSPSALGPAPSTPPPAPSPAPSVECTASLVLRQTRELLAGQEFEAHYLTIGARLTLSVWLVDPEIDPATAPVDVPRVGRQAVARGLSLAYELVSEMPCLRRVFDQVNPMIVDAQHHHWYKDFLPVTAFIGLQNPSTDEIVAALALAGTTPEDARGRAPRATATTGAGSCGWSQARAAIRPDLGADDNAAAYLIVGARLVPQGEVPPDAPDDVGVEVQWQMASRAEASDARVRQRLDAVAGALKCLTPPIDSLEAFVVDPNGRTLVYAVVPGSVIRAGVIPLPPAAVRLFRPSYDPVEPTGT